ncbi:alpha/beta hydrolase [Nonomuraea lactucae]|uniref:alpha/beta hydrolase n=1 Tax=Nonomuraea lactucae TaxID=2249762 RepID=UPI000DE1EF5A|nr:alpha/beta hydrolase [Nonomuraea lactucae]
MSKEQLAVLEDMLRNGPLDIAGDLAQQRELFEAMLAAIPLPGDVTTKATELGGVPVVISETPGIDSGKVVFYLHGGAYVLGSATAALGLASDVARRAGARGVVVDYRLAPEHPFPAAVDDTVAVYKALLDDGVPASKIAFVGESAGGGLTIATLVALKQAGLPQPASAVVFSPWADLSLTGQSLTGKADVDPSLTAEGLRLRAGDYLNGADPHSVLASPIYADLTGLPPLHIQVGSHEVLLDDSLRLAARAAAHDVPVELQVWPYMPHIFQAFSALLDEAGEALQASAAFTTRHWADETQP